MSEPQPLGDFIRERRLALGFSAGQLAMRLKSTAAVVRTWERGHEPVPGDAFAGLADLLDVPEGDLRALQPAEDGPPVEEEAPTAPASIVALSEETATAEAVAEAPDDSTSAGSDEKAVDPEAETDDTERETEPDAAVVELVAEESVDDDESDEPEIDGSTNGGSLETAVGHAPGLDIDTGLLEAPTEAIEPVRPLRTALATRPGRRVRPAALAEPETTPEEPPSVEPAATEVNGTVPAWLGPFMAIFDPDKRYIYWARWIGTAIGLYILLRVLGFALDGLVEAIGDFWDSFSTPEGPLGDDAVTSLGPFL